MATLSNSCIQISDTSSTMAANRISTFVRRFVVTNQHMNGARTNLKAIAPSQTFSITEKDLGFRVGQADVFGNPLRMAERRWTSVYTSSSGRYCSISASAVNASSALQTINEGSTNSSIGSSPVSGNAIRKQFLDFYAARDHAILPSSSLVPEDPTVLLTIAGMLQFKPIFLGQVPRKVPRATTSQKCIRTNDVENVGRTARHHTFFEMLGNFSFGDYFKEQACAWAWELATKEYKLPVERVWISVYEEDDETFAIWRDQVGVSPDRIQRMGAEDNFWSSGATGPCGPCSEMYFDFHPERGIEGADLGDDSRFIEFYNLVFMQYNRLEDGSLEGLKNKNIDTGLGLERMAQILQKVPNNYETDLIFPIIQVAAQLAGIDYHAANEKTKTQLKVIGDHTRAVVYLISDGVTPSNIGRGYVVRRLIRRVVRMGRLLGITAGEEEGAFLPIVARQVIAMSPPLDSEVQKNSNRILDELKREEQKFVQTLERGEKLLEDLLSQAVAATSSSSSSSSSSPLLSGKDAFLLYDTYGFPVEITEEVAMERGVTVDMDGFATEMDAQRKRAQAAHSAVKLSVGGAAAELASQLPPTAFLGYSLLQSQSTVLALVADGQSQASASVGQTVDVFLNQTPFYAESGGQIGDLGTLQVVGAGEEGSRKVLGVLRVQDTQKQQGGDLWVHRAVVEEGRVEVGEAVLAVVDSEQRTRSQSHHTATHLLQAALKKVLGSDTSQAGSLVAFDRLRFDFNSPRPITEQELADIEDLVNGWIGESVDLESSVLPIGEAKAKGAIAMFGEKYGDEVRVVNVPGISMELCGGTHVSNTAQIRGFKIVSEAGIASGVRRIEAVAGPAVMEYLNSRDAVLKTLSSALKVKAEDIPVRVTSLQEELKVARSEASELRAQLAVTKAELLAETAVTVGSARIIVASMDGVDPESLKLASEKLLARLGDPAAVVLGSPVEGKVSIVAAFSPQVVKAGLQAGKFVGAIAKICGGGGGGRPNLAQAGGKQPQKLPEALEHARQLLESGLSK